jgi:hypothetical protein
MLAVDLVPISHCEYLGLDWIHSYMIYARRRYGREFVATDVCDYVTPMGSGL